MVVVIAVALLVVLPGAGILAQSEAGPDQSPVRRPAFKGYELYSWQSSDGAWRYALVLGTNRLKNWSEIEKAVVSEEELRKALAELAPVETVTWCHRRVEGWPALVRPPQDRIEDLIALAHRHEVRLQVCTPREENGKGTSDASEGRQRR
jgi:hypothetical protein